MKLLLILTFFLIISIFKKSDIEKFDNFKHVVKYVNFKKLTLEKFNKLIYSKKPIIFYNVLKDNITLDKFCSLLGDKKINVRTGNYSTIEGRRKNKLSKLTNSEKISEYCKKFNDENYNGYGGNNKILQEEISKLNLVPNNDFIGNFPSGKLWIGKKNTKTPLHKDYPKNLALHLVGTKKWVVFNSNDIKNLCYDEKNDILEWSNYEIGNYNTCKAAKKAKQINLEINQGEMLYLPEQWSHDVTNITDSIMVNFWYLSKSIWKSCNNKVYLWKKKN